MKRVVSSRWSFLLALLLAVAVLITSKPALSLELEVAERCVVKVYGAGGYRGLESYQTGFLVSDDGLILTIDSVALEQGEALIVLADGSRYSGKLKSVDPMTGAALVSILPGDRSLDHFDLSVDRASSPFVGEIVFALSNAFNIAVGVENVSVQRGVVSALVPIEALLAQRRYPRRGMAMLLDVVTSNPGAGGGAVVDSKGNLLGMIGPEEKSPLTGTWVNYALTTETLREALSRMEHSKPRDEFRRLADDDLATIWEEAALQELGFVFIPSLSPRTPPYLEHVEQGSLADASGLRPDDLVIAVNGVQTINAREAALAVLSAHRAGEPWELAVIREEAIVTCKSPRSETRQGAP